MVTVTSDPRRNSIFTSRSAEKSVICPVIRRDICDAASPTAIAASLRDRPSWLMRFWSSRANRARGMLSLRREAAERDVDDFLRAVLRAFVAMALVDGETGSNNGKADLPDGPTVGKVNVH